MEVDVKGGLHVGDGRIANGRITTRLQNVARVIVRPVVAAVSNETVAAVTCDCYDGWESFPLYFIGSVTQVTCLPRFTRVKP